MTGTRAKANGPSAVEEPQRFLGLSLSGGKADKSAFAALEYFPKQNRLFLNRIVDKIKAEEFISADLKVHELILQFADNCKSLTFDVPLSLPHCLNCELKCGGYETCSLPENKWMRAHYMASDKRKPKKMFTPYTQRCVDLYLQEIEGGALEAQHALGANLAPLTARAIFISRKLKQDLPQLVCAETFARLSVWRLARLLKISPLQYKVYRNSVGGDEARRQILHAISEKTGTFVYVQDQKMLIENYHAFDAFICGLLGYFESRGWNEVRPHDFPRRESWIQIPGLLIEKFLR